MKAAIFYRKNCRYACTSLVFLVQPLARARQLRSGCRARRTTVDLQLAFRLRLVQAASIGVVEWAFAGQRNRTAFPLNFDVIVFRHRADDIENPVA